MSNVEDFNLESNEEKEYTMQSIHKLLGNQAEGISFISPNDSFEFECQRCGACCMNRRDIILSPYDIYNGAKYLGITTTEFMQKYTYHSLGNQSKIPMILLETNKSNGFCPLLKLDYKGSGKFKCAIHEAKPGACRNHPIGIMSSIHVDEETGETTTKTGYIKVNQCPQSKTGKMQSVADWMADYVAHEEEYDLAREMTMVTGSVMNWQGLFLMSSAFMFSLLKRGIAPSGDTMISAFEMMASKLVHIAYENYDTSKPFSEQCRANMEQLRQEFMDISEDVYIPMCNVFNALSDKKLDDLLDEAKETHIEQVAKYFIENDIGYPGFEVGCGNDINLGDDNKEESGDEG